MMMHFLICAACWAAVSSHQQPSVHEQGADLTASSVQPLQHHGSAVLLGSCTGIRSPMIPNIPASLQVLVTLTVK